MDSTSQPPPAFWPRSVSEHPAPLRVLFCPCASCGVGFSGCYLLWRRVGLYQNHWLSCEELKQRAGLNPGGFAGSFACWTKGIFTQGSAQRTKQVNFITKCQLNQWERAALGVSTLMCAPQQLCEHQQLIVQRCSFPPWLQLRAQLSPTEHRGWG